MSHETEIVAVLETVIADLRAENARLRMGLENTKKQLRGPAAPVLDCVGYLTIKHHADGGLQVSGNMGDINYALSLLDHAKDSVRAHHRAQTSPVLAPDGNPIVSVPNRDVDLKQSPDFPTKAFGDMPPEDRGDLPP